MVGPRKASGPLPMDHADPSIVAIFSYEGHTQLQRYPERLEIHFITRPHDTASLKNLVGLGKHFAIL